MAKGETPARGFLVMTGPDAQMDLLGNDFTPANPLPAG